MNNVMECIFMMFPDYKSTSVSMDKIDAARQAFSLMGMSWDLAYFHDSSHTPKGM